MDSSEYILDTTLTWSDLQSECHKIFGSNAIFGSDKQAVDIGEGKGFVSRTCLIEPKWASSIEPKKFVVKVDRSAFGDDDYIQVIIVPKNSAANEDNDYSSTSRKIYCTVPFTPENPKTGYIIMEYIENTITTHLWNNLEIDEALRVLAVLQAASLKFTEEEKKSLSYNPLYDIFSQIKLPNVSLFKAGTLNQTEKPKATVSTGVACRTFVEDTHVESKINVFREILPDIYDLDYLYGIGKQLKMSPVFVHGDAWSTNFLWKKTAKGLQLAALIDFQTSYLGQPGGDVLRVISCFLSTKQRRAHWNELIQYFYETFLEMIQPIPAPYSLEQNIRRYYPMVRLVYVIPQCYERVKDTFDEEKKVKMKEILLEKLDGIVEDVVFYHERNNMIKASLQETND